MPCAKQFWPHRWLSLKLNFNLIDPLKGAKILLVDDLPANLSILAAALEPRGCQLLAACEGNVSAAARILGTNRMRVYRLLMEGKKRQGYI